MVDDPADAGELTLSMVYRGGVVVYLNGRELARGSMPEGEITAETVAEDYPIEAYAVEAPSKTGNATTNTASVKKPDPGPLRERRLESVKIPQEMLKKGVNTLAIGLCRTVLPPERTRLHWDARIVGNWVQVGLVSLKLQTAGKGVQSGCSRPSGFQVWNAGADQRITDADYGLPGERLYPISMLAPVNGVASGQIIAGSDAAIRNLKAVIGSFKGPGLLPAGAVQIRYPRYDALLSAAPAEVTVRTKTQAGRAGAVQPVWVTVDVPADAVPGDYTAELVVSADGAEPVKVPVKLTVSTFKVPQPRDCAGYVDLIQSPETVALQYGVELWSDKHFALIESSCRLLGKLGSRVAYVHLISKTNHGNSQSMVRWVKKAPSTGSGQAPSAGSGQVDGSLSPDYSIMDRYLDIWEKNCGKPDVVALYVWEPVAGGAYMGGSDMKAKPLSATVVNPDGRTEDLTLPLLGTPESETFWKPVFDEIRARLNKRGISDSNTMVGCGMDVRPTKATVEFFKKVAPGAAWILQTHAGPDVMFGVPVGYKAHVWNVPSVSEPEKKRLYGWQNKMRLTAFLREGCKWRSGVRGDSPLPVYRLVSEAMFLAGQRGYGRLGADFWAVKSGGPNAFVLHDRYPDSRWGQLSIGTSCSSVLAPGPDGAVSTVRYELLREGLQEAEARYVIERALTSPALKTKLGDELALRCQALLDDRAHWCVDLVREDPRLEWFSGAAWRELNAKVFAAAAEVAARTEEKTSGMKPDVLERK